MQTPDWLILLIMDLCAHIYVSVFDRTLRNESNFFFPSSVEFRSPETAAKQEVARKGKEEEGSRGWNEPDECSDRDERRARVTCA